MEIELMSVSKDKYMDTDIDSLLLRFDNSDEKTFVSEYEVPDENKYIVMLSERDNLNYPVCIEIINPSEVSESSPLPDIGKIMFKDKIMSLREVIKELIKS